MGLGLLCALGAVVGIRNICIDCDGDGQDITAIGDRHPDEDAYDDALSANQPALTITDDEPIGEGTEPLTLFGTDSNGADSNGADSNDTATTEPSAENDSEAATAADDPADEAADPESNGDADANADGTGSAAAVVPIAVESTVPTDGSAFYVNPSGGNDGNDGATEATALKTVLAAFRQVQAGGTVYLMNGDYRENKTPGQVHFHFSQANGRPDAWIRLAAAPGHRPVLHATNGTGLLIQANYVEVSGLTIKGSGFNSGNAWGVGISVADSHHVRVVGNTVSGMPVSGIGANKTSNVQIINNVVYENSYWSSLNGSGISVYGATNRGQGPDVGGYHDLIIGNRVFRNENKVNSQFNPGSKTDGNGIIIDENRMNGYTGRTLIANNLSYDNGGRGILAYRSNHVDIMFNTTYHNGRTGNALIGGPVEMSAGRASDVTFHSNIAWARSGVPAFTMSFENGGGIESRGNVWVTDSPSDWQDEYDGTNNRVVSGNPGLRNPGTGSGADFRPAAGSELIGYAGAGHGAVPNDILGTGRGRSAEPGAFEAEAASGR